MEMFCLSLPSSIPPPRSCPRSLPLPPSFSLCPFLPPSPSCLLPSVPASLLFRILSFQFFFCDYHATHPSSMYKLKLFNYLAQLPWILQLCPKSFSLCRWNYTIKKKKKDTNLKNKTFKKSSFPPIARNPASAPSSLQSVAFSPPSLYSLRCLFFGNGNYCFTNMNLYLLA